MTAPLPFTVHAALPCQPHAGFAASLAAELGAFDHAALEGDLTRAIRAAELRCALPFDEDAREAAEARLRRLRSG